MMTRQKKSCRLKNLCLSRETVFSGNKISSSSLSMSGIIIPPYRNIYSAHLFKLAFLCKNCAYGPFRHGTFWQESFHHGNILAHAPLSAANVLADGHFNTGTFRHGEFSAQGIFGMRNFRHRNRDISAWSILARVISARNNLA